jgi:hypothetical protein
MFHVEAPIATPPNTNKDNNRTTAMAQPRPLLAPSIQRKQHPIVTLSRLVFEFRAGVGTCAM